jgi:hypothetical protein
MSTSVDVSEPSAPLTSSTSFLRPQGRTRVKGGTITASWLLVAVGVLFLVGMSYLNALVGPSDVQDIGQNIGEIVGP